MKILYAATEHDYADASCGPRFEQTNFKSALDGMGHQLLARLVGFSRFDLGSRDQRCAEGMPPEYHPNPAGRPESGNIFVNLMR
jgi:hypothetical protein